MAKQNKFDVVAAVKANSRELFKQMPKPKRIADKRQKPPRNRKWEEE